MSDYDPYRQREDELVRENAGLALQLHIAEIEVRRLKTALEDANNEINRLGMVVRHQTESLAFIRRNGK